MERVKYLVPLVLAAFLLSACATEFAWRRAVTETIRIPTTTANYVMDTADNFLDMGRITAEQHAQIKDLFNKGEKIQKQAIKAAKIANDAADVQERDAWLEEYDRVLTELRGLIYELIDLAKEWGILGEKAALGLKLSMEVK